ncbi:MAG TPA: ABC transporter permease subunit [Cellulomonas sp.]
MSATTAPHAATPHLTLPGLWRSEWIKFWTLRSTYWTLAATAVVFLGVIALVSLAIRSLNPADAGNLDTSLVPFSAAVQIATIPLLVLGALIITGEYSTGQIRSTFTAVPTRLRVLWTKGALLAVVTAVVSAVLVAVGAGISLAVTTGSKVHLDLHSHETLRILGGSVLYLVTITLFAFALGGLLRHPAVALATVLGLLLLVENIVAGVGLVWHPLQRISPFLPGSAGSRITASQGQIDMLNQQNVYGIHLTAWEGYGLLVAWVVVILAFAAVRLRSTDA